MDPNDIIKAEKIQRDSDQSVLECLVADIDFKADRSNLILTALHAASVPLDLLTASILHDLGCEMGLLIRAACGDTE